MEAYTRNDEEKEGLLSINEERKSSIISAIENTMIIKDTSISGRENLIRSENRINFADKMIFYLNITFFVFLTIMNLMKIFT